MMQTDIERNTEGGEVGGGGDTHISKWSVPAKAKPAMHPARNSQKSVPWYIHCYRILVGSTFENFCLRCPPASPLATPPHVAWAAVLASRLRYAEVSKETYYEAKETY